ncbi:MAG: DUF5716 family protein, partial [Clostridiales bacterium]|jgi:hypothetical protein|nr:DUF5716 family protein [Clostridiales bacterium]
MLWARHTVSETMKNATVVFHRNSKGVAAEGASIIAAKELKALAGKTFTLNDRNRLEYDVGFKIMRDRKERFLPVAERNAFWWQAHPAKQLILMTPTEQTVEIDLYKRLKDGTERPIKKIALEGLPKRPAGATRMLVSLVFQSGDSVCAKIKDMGFGELFPAENYEKEVLIHL